MTWAARAAASILPLSQERVELARALREWRYTGNFYDLEAPSADCELCGHPDIRYQFEIRNLHTSAELLIGSECITRFGIAATDEEGRTLDSASTRRKVSRDRRQLIQDAKRRRAISSLVALANIDPEFKIDSFIDYLQTRGAFTPNQLSTLLWRLRKYGISHTPGDFKLTIRRDREKAQLRAMPDWKLKQLEPCMTSAQKAFLKRPRSPIWGDD